MKVWGNIKAFIVPDDDTRIDSATVQMVAYLLKHDAHHYAHMNGKDAIEFAANALLKADRECMS
jgi:hypothetical protein